MTLSLAEMRVVDHMLRPRGYDPQQEMAPFSVLLGRAGAGKTQALALRAADAAAAGQHVLFVTLEDSAARIYAQINPKYHANVHVWERGAGGALNPHVAAVIREARAHAADVVLIDEIGSLKHGSRMGPMTCMCGLASIQCMTGAKVMATMIARHASPRIRGKRFDTIILDETL